MSQPKPGRGSRGRGPGSSGRYFPPEVRRSQIINAAAIVFAKNGFPATRMSDIAQQAGVSQGSIYRFFHSKEDIAMTLFSVGEQACRAKLESLISTIPATNPLHIVRDFIEWYARYLVRRRGIVVALFSWELDPAGRHGADIGERTWIAERLSELLKDAGAADPPYGADIGRLIPLALYAFTALAHLYHVPGEDADESLVRTVTDVTGRILGLDSELRCGSGARSD